MCVHCEYAKARERADWYNLLAECFYPPEEPFLHMIQEWSSRIGESDFVLPRKIPELVELQRDFARLFVGPFEVLAPPYGSIYLEGEKTIYGDSTQDVVRRYNEEGLEVRIKEPPDHVAIELEYLYLLSYREAEALKAENEEKAAVYRDKQADFLASHLGVWFPIFAQKVMEHAETGFYKKIAAATDSYIQQVVADRVSSLA